MVRVLSRSIDRETLNIYNLSFDLLPKIKSRFIKFLYLTRFILLKTESYIYIYIYILFYDFKNRKQEMCRTETCPSEITDDKPKPNANAKEEHFRDVQKNVDVEVYVTAATEFLGPKAKTNFPMEINVENKADHYHTM